MLKNKGKGGKNRKRWKNEADHEKRELVFKEDGQKYTQVLCMLGNSCCEATCIHSVTCLYHIRGTMHKKVWIIAGYIILVGLRDYQARSYAYKRMRPGPGGYEPCFSIYAGVFQQEGRPKCAAHQLRGLADGVKWKVCK